MLWKSAERGKGVQFRETFSDLDKLQVNVLFCYHTKLSGSKKYGSLE